MKKYIITLLLCIIPLCAFSQIRSKVCIVRPNYSENVVKMINDFIPRLKKLGIEDPEKYVDDFFTNGTSGSGFVYVAPDGKNYIITNRHVISDAETSTIIFEDEKTKTKKIIKEMKIVASDASLDIALLEFPPDEQPFTSGFEFYNETVSDGDPVFTAGYPGLISKPVWQFGTGIITNASVEVEEMIKPELSTLIQHSAQIDGGNSGGPLLVKTEDGNYKVIGINTWKITNRQDTNFAIPATTVEKFINNFLSGEKRTSPDSQEGIIENATKLHKTLNKYNVTFEELVDYISIDYVANEGKAIFEKAINNCNENNRKTINTLIENQSPIEGIRFAISWYLFNEYHRNEVYADQSKKSSVKETDLPELDPPIKVQGTDYWNTVLYNGYTRRNLIVTWTYTNGGWEIFSVGNKIGKNDVDEVLKKKNTKKEKDSITIPEDKIDKIGNVVLYMPFNVHISYGKNIISNRSQDFLLLNTVNCNITIKNYLSGLIAVDFFEEYLHIVNAGEYSPNLKYITPTVGAQGQLPFIIKNSVIMPYLNLQCGPEFSNLTDLNTELIVKTGLGTRFLFSIAHNKLGLFLDTNVNAKIHTKDFTQKDFTFNVSAGIAF